MSRFSGPPVPLHFSIADIPHREESVGHPRMSPERVRITKISGILRTLEDAKVIADPEERKAKILKGIESTVQTMGEGLHVIADPELVDEIVGLVEWPVVFGGWIDRGSRYLPRQVLQTALRYHQKMLSVCEKTLEGDRIVGFIGVADIEPADGGKVMERGYHRVVRARLADAKFIWDQDCKDGLAKISEGLPGMLMLTGGGNMAEKSQRIAKIMGHLLPDHPRMAKRIGEICKADLLSATVREFPQLQGIVGAILFSLENNQDEFETSIENIFIAEALGSQYEVNPTKGDLASGGLRVADNIDTLWSLFALGRRPSSTSDPMGLRRSCLIILKSMILSEIDWEIPDLIQLAKRYQDKSLKVSDGAEDAMLEFFRGRMLNLLKNRFPGEPINAEFLQSQKMNPYRIVRRVHEIVRENGWQNYVLKEE